MNKVKFLNIKNSKKNLNYTIKVDHLTRKFLVYVYDQKAENIIRVVEIPMNYIFKLLAQRQ